MIDKDDPGLIKLDSKNKAAVYDLLFGKATDNLKSAKDIALLYLGSPYYAKQVLEEYNNIKKVNIFTTAEFKFIYEPFEKEQNYRIWYVEDPKDTFKECDMKFDGIIMNPPYSRNLHLKILAEVIKHLKDDGICVNLSPVRWLQDPLAASKKKSDFNKYEETISKRIQQLDVIDKLRAQTYFPNTVMGMDLGIYVCGKAGGFDYTSLVDKMLVKVLKKQTSHIVFDYDKNDGIRVRFPLISNNGGSGTGRKASLAGFGKLIWFEDGKRDGKWWYDWYMHNQYTKTAETIPYSAKFDTKLEADNFCKSFDTAFAKVYTHLVKSDVNITPEIVLWLGSAVNPRTGLKGYNSEWTDEDFYKFFNITPEEQKVIEETMAKYK